MQLRVDFKVLEELPRNAIGKVNKKELAKKLLR